MTKEFKDPAVEAFFRLSNSPGFKLVKCGYKRLKLKMCVCVPLNMAPTSELWIDVAAMYYGNAIPEVIDL